MTGTTPNEALANEFLELIAVTERANELLANICNRADLPATARMHLGVSRSSMGQAVREFRRALDALTPIPVKVE